ncbi:hypothetical protein ERJ70_16055 [Sediminibacillus dalangtanensis]|uniref:DUF4362 domain-containing protein n=1 Tax=Sediminibacillus dalangtanensis TaxID=2729421 RepID=A0ABX7VVU5_9BACI|nr:hypothetical protein [Sediminibacillus dalangtanensis]QTN00669.1 hypothetical protein ERJ70_16055 [Sediminibacillus dalangtanensis]
MKRSICGFSFLMGLSFLLSSLPVEVISAQDQDTFKEQIENFGKKKTNKMPVNYTLSEAKRNGDITPGNMTEKQKKRILEFKENVKNKKTDFIRFSSFSKGGIAPIIKEYQFNGEIIYYRYDSTRSVNSSQKVVEDYCKKIEYLDKPFKSTFLTNCFYNESIEF